MVMTQGQWTALHQSVNPYDIYNEIGQSLRLLPRMSGFNRYEALWNIYSLISKARGFGRPFYADLPDCAQTLAGEVLTAMRAMAKCVLQDEFATVLNNTPPYLFSTGFYLVFVALALIAFIWL